MSTIKVDTIKDETGAKTLVTQSGSDFAWGAGVPAGTTIQTVGKSLKNSYSDTATFSDWVAITGFEVDISPKQLNSDFLISLTTSVSGTGSSEGHILLRRGYDASGGTSFTETDINGDANGNRTRSTFVHAYDFGSSADMHSSNLDTVTSNIWDNDISYVAGSKFRYKVYWRNTLNTTGDLYLNHTSYNAVESATGISSIIIQEIAGT